MRERGRGHSGQRFGATPMLASAPRSRHILCYPFLSSQSSICSLKARLLPLFWPSSAVRPWVRGFLAIPRRGTNRIRGCQYLGFNPQRRAPAAICSVFIDIYKFYVAGFPLCALVTACCGCLETASYPPPPRQALGTRSSHAPDTSVRLLPQSPAPRRRARPISPRSASWPAPPRICRRSLPRSRRPT